MSNPLQCPVCQESLDRAKDGMTFRCPANHSFDLAKEGYINLLMSYDKKSENPGDSKEMVTARTAFLSKGYYQGVSDAINQTILNALSNQGDLSPNLLDLGCGEGYYLERLMSFLSGVQYSPNFFGLDISKMAIKVAGKRNKQATWLVGNSYFAPFHGDSLGLILSVFSPIELAECARILKNEGYLIRVFPQIGHLMEIKEIIYPEIKVKEYEQYKEGQEGLQLVSQSMVTYPISLEKEDIGRLLFMTPHFWRVKTENKEKLLALSHIDVTVAVQIAIFQKS